MADIKKTTTQAAGPGKILIVDTESMLSEILQFRFQNEGYAANVCRDGREALKLDLPSYSIILVDLMDQEFNGLRFTSAVKNNPDTVSIPVIIMSAHASEDNIVEGLDAGADDYISKPFSTRELIARVRSVIRRRNMLNARRRASVVRFNDLSLDMNAGSAFLDGMELSLSQNEFKLLSLFLSHPNRFFDRDELREHVWNNDASLGDRSIDTGVSRLRKKLCDYGRYLINRKGFGYGFVES